MLVFQVNVEDNGDTQITSEMTAVILETAVAAIRAKAQELYLNCSVNVNISLDAYRMVPT